MEDTLIDLMNRDLTDNGIENDWSLDKAILLRLDWGKQFRESKKNRKNINGWKKNEVFRHTRKQKVFLYKIRLHIQGKEKAYIYAPSGIFFFQ